ncbi:MAG: hypothetical protein WC833_08300 [Bacteroidales bacterium]|jgi:hypothetical protein
MGVTQVKGRKVVVKQPSDVLFGLFSDLNNFTRNLPDGVLEKSEIKSTSDTLLAKVQGFEMGLKVDERTPFSSIKYVQYGKSPIAFVFKVLLSPVNDAETEFHLELDAELSGIFKMMLGSKLQGAIDKVTDELEKGFSGVIR